MFTGVHLETVRRRRPAQASGRCELNGMCRRGVPAVALYYLAAVGFSLILVADQAHLINPIDRLAASGPDPDVQLIGLTDHVVNQFSVGLIRHGCKQLQLLATMMCEGARADKT